MSQGRGRAPHSPEESEHVRVGVRAILGADGGATVVLPPTMAAAVAAYEQFALQAFRALVGKADRVEDLVRCGLPVDGLAVEHVAQREVGEVRGVVAVRIDRAVGFDMELAEAGDSAWRQGG